MKFYFSKRERVIGVVVIMMFTGYSVYHIGYELFWMRWQSLENRRISAERVFEEKLAVLKRYASNESDRQQHLEDYRQTESDERIRSSVLLHLQDLSSKNNVRIADMKPIQIRQDLMFKEFPVNITLEGGFVDLMHFFYDIETARAGFQIQEFRFSQAHAAHKILRCQAVIARIFFNFGQE